jgi:ATP-dependent Zn protease
MDSILVDLFQMGSGYHGIFGILRRARDQVIDRWYAIDERTRKRIAIAILLAESVSLSLFLRKIILAKSKSTRDALAPVLVVVGLSSLISMIKEGRISSVSFFPDGKLEGFDEKANQIFQSQRVPGSESVVFDIVSKNCSDYRMIPSKTNALAVAAQVILPLAFLGVWYKVLQSFMKSATEDNTNFDRKTTIPKISFGHVVSGSKIELQEIVDYLNNPTSFSQYGAKLPRGVLLVGPSGTGKTLMARAVAGEAKCAFLSVSASEFVETYVGRGSARIRQLFKQARMMTPCVLFIDEIDALGRRQGTFAGGTAHDEYVQTMNQLLVELDGISGHEDGLVVIGATNRFYALDSALLRPGRFDRHVWLTLPSDQERLDILKLNFELRGLNLASLDVDLVAIAKESISFSGADLANLVNEAIFLSIRRKASRVSMNDLRLAFTKCKQVVYNRNRNVSSPTNRPSRYEDISTALE